MLLRLIECLKGTPGLGLMFYGHENDLEFLIVDMAADADHGGEVVTAKSTGGYDTALAGPRTWIHYEWNAKGLSTTSRNTAEAELQSLDIGTFRSAVPFRHVMEQVLDRPGRILGREDNSAAFLAVRRGYSRHLAHMKKHHKLSISALHETFYGDPDVVGEEKLPKYNTLVQEPTKTQRADIYTKPVSPVRHWELVTQNYMDFRKK